MTAKRPANTAPPCSLPPLPLYRISEYFSFEALRISNHATRRFAEKCGLSAQLGPGGTAPPRFCLFHGKALLRREARHRRDRPPGPFCRCRDADGVPRGGCPLQRIRAGGRGRAPRSRLPLTASTGCMPPSRRQEAPASWPPGLPAASPGSTSRPWRIWRKNRPSCRWWNGGPQNATIRRPARPCRSRPRSRHR